MQTRRRSKRMKLNGNEKKKYKKSQEEKEAKKGPKECLECGKVLSSASCLSKHMLIHSGERKYPCSECDKSFVRSDHLREHWRNVHVTRSVVKEKKNYGEKPQKIKKSERPIIENGIERKTRKKVCHFCDMKFQVWKDLHAHMDAQHREFLPYQCEWCLHRYEALQKLRYHQEKEHPEEYSQKRKTFFKYCEHCGKEFRMRHYYNLHIQRHLGRVKCGYCDESFPRKEELIQHKNNRHADMLRFVCDICSRRYASKMGVADHIAKSHPADKQCCEYCGVYIIRKDRMRDHVLTHTGERPHVCDICGKGFTQRNDMSKHRTLHFREGTSGPIVGVVERKPRRPRVPSPMPQEQYLATVSQYSVPEVAHQQRQQPHEGLPLLVTPFSRELLQTVQTANRPTDMSMSGQMSQWSAMHYAAAAQSHNWDAHSHFMWGAGPSHP